MLGKALKPPLFRSLFLWLKTYFFNAKNNVDYNSSLPYLIDANWLIAFIFCVKRLGKKKLAVNKWVTLIIRKSIKKFITWFFWKRSCFTKSSKQGGCYLVLLKVKYRSSHFWILWKTLSLDYRPKGKRIILKSKNFYNLLI